MALRELDHTAEVHLDYEYQDRSASHHGQVGFVALARVHTDFRVLFEADIQRCDNQGRFAVRPVEAKAFQQQTIAKEPVEAKLLNPTLEVSGY